MKPTDDNFSQNYGGQVQRPEFGAPSATLEPISVSTPPVVVSPSVPAPQLVQPPDNNSDLHFGGSVYTPTLETFSSDEEPVVQAPPVVSPEPINSAPVTPPPISPFASLPPLDTTPATDTSLDEQYNGSTYDSSLETAPTELTPVIGMTPVESPRPSIDQPSVPSNIRSDRFSAFKYNRTALLITGAVVSLMLVIGLGTYFFGSRAAKSNTTAVSSSTISSQYAVGSLPLTSLAITSQLKVGTAEQLTINGQLLVNDTVVLAPGVAPATPVTGQFYYNKTTNQPYYYNGTTFVSIEPTITTPAPTTAANVCVQGAANCGFALAGSGVTTVNALAGALTIADATGTGSTITIQDASTTQKGIAKFNAADFIATAGVIDTVQGITTTSDVQFASLGLGTTSTTGNLTLGATGSLIANTLTHTGTGNNLVLNSGADNVSFVTGNGANTFFLPTSGGPGQTLCTTAITCASGGGQAVILEPQSGGVTAIQTANANIDSIAINKASGTGNVIKLQTGGVDAFTINSTGNTTISNTTTITSLHTNSITPTAALTIGATTQSYSLQGNASSTISATNAGSTTAIGFVTPTANVNYQFGTATAGTYSVCTTAVVCAGYTPSSGSSSYLQVQGTTPGSAQTGNTNITGTSIAGTFSGSGASLTSLNGTNISSGTVADARLTTNVTLQGNTFNGVSQLVQTTAGGILPVISGANLTALNGTNISSGTVADARLTTNVTLQGNTFNGVSQLVQTTAGGILPVLSGANLTSLNGTNISSGTVADARLTTNVTLQGNTFNGVSQLVQLTAGGILPVLSGANLTSLNGTNISSGTVADARLSANVALLNGTGPQTFTGNNKFTGTVLSQNAANSTAAFQVQNAVGTGILTVDTTNALAILNGNLNFATGANRTLSVNIPSTNVAGNTLTIAAASGGAGATGVAGGNLTLKAGDAVGTTGAATGGSTFIQFGNGANGGVNGTVNIQDTGGNNFFQFDSLNSGTFTCGVFLSNTCTIKGGSTLNITNVASNPASGINLQPGTNGVLVTPRSNTTTAFQVQTAASTSILNVDSTNLRVSVGSIGTATGQLYVAGLLPTTTSTLATGSTNAQFFTVQGRYAYIANNSTGNFMIIDTTRPANMAVISTTTPTGMSSPYAVAVAGKYAYVTNNTDTTNAYGLEILDVSNPSAPVLVGHIGTNVANTGGARQLVVQGRYVFLINAVTNTIQSFDVANPTAPVALTTQSTGTTPIAITIQGRYAYVTNQGASTFTVFDISNPSSIPAGTAWTTATATPIPVAVSGRYAYVMSSTSASSFQVFDISNPTSPAAAIGSTTGGSTPISISVQGRYAYVAYNGGNFQVFDISNPTAPSSIGTYATGLTSVAGLTVSGRSAYITASTGISSLDLGGTYSQQLEAGGIETGTLQVNNTANFSNSVSIAGGLQLAQSLQVSGSIGSNGSVLFQNAINSTSAFQVQNATGATVLGVDTTNGYVGVGTAVPAAKLQVEGAPGAVPVELRVMNDSNFGGSDSILGLYTSAFGSSVLEIRAQRSPILASLQVGGGYPLVLQAAGGNVGIGTTAPATDLSFGSGSNRTIAVNTPSTNVAGNTLTIASANAGAGATGMAGADLVLKAGSAAGTTGAAGGGSVVIHWGSAVNSGTTDGAVKIQDAAGNQYFQFDNGATSGSNGSMTCGLFFSNPCSIRAGNTLNLVAAQAAAAVNLFPGTAGAVVKPSADTVTDFTVQNAAGTAIFTTDSTNSQVVLGKASSISGKLQVLNSTNANTVTLVAGVTSSSYSLTLPTAGPAVSQCLQSDSATASQLKFAACSNTHTKTVILTAEYAGTVLDPGTGANNSGTMTSAIDLTNRENYYQWVTTQATSQSYDVDIQIPIPSDFSAWAGTPISIDTYTTNTTNGTLQVEARTTAGSVESGCNFVAITPSANSTWQTKTGCTIAGTYTAGGYMTLRIRMYATSAVTAVKVGNITLSYTTAY